MDYDLSDIIDGDYNADYLNNNMTGGGCDDDLFNTEQYLPFLADERGQFGGGCGSVDDMEYSHAEIMGNLFRLVGGSVPMRGGDQKIVSYDAPGCTGKVRFRVFPGNYLYFLTDNTLRITPDNLNLGTWTVGDGRVAVAPFTTNPMDAAAWVKAATGRRVYIWKALNVNNLSELPAAYHGELTNPDNKSSNGKLKNKALVEYIESERRAGPGCRLDGAAFRDIDGNNYQMILDMNLFTDNLRIDWLGSIDYPSGGEYPVAGKVSEELNNLLGRKVQNVEIIPSAVIEDPQSNTKESEVADSGVADSGAVDSEAAVGGSSPSFLESLLGDFKW